VNHEILSAAEPQPKKNKEFYPQITQIIQIEKGAFLILNICVIKRWKRSGWITLLKTAPSKLFAGKGLPDKTFKKTTKLTDSNTNHVARQSRNQKS